jgi:hypothetical protein
MSIRARILLTVEVDSGAKYGDDWTMGDIKKVAKREAINKLREVIKKAYVNMTIVEDPKIIKFIHSEPL